MKTIEILNMWMKDKRSLRRVTKLLSCYWKSYIKGKGVPGSTAMTGVRRQGDYPLKPGCLTHMLEYGNPVSIKKYAIFTWSNIYYQYFNLNLSSFSLYSFIIIYHFINNQARAIPEVLNVCYSKDIIVIYAKSKHHVDSK